MKPIVDLEMMRELTTPTKFDLEEAMNERLLDEHIDATAPELY